VQNDDSRFATGDEPPNQGQHVERMPNVEMTRRFIEQENARVLRDGQRDPDALPFAA